MQETQFSIKEVACKNIRKRNDIQANEIERDE
jgi:hypothetical protein